MKKILPIVVLLLFPWHLARGQVPYLEEVKALGVISGQGMAADRPGIRPLRCWRAPSC